LWLKIGFGLANIAFFADLSKGPGGIARPKTPGRPCLVKRTSFFGKKKSLFSSPIGLFL